MENVAKTNRMGSEKIPTLLLKMALPMMFSMVVSALYNIVDSIFIGMMEAPFNEKAITALGYAYPLQTLLVAVAIGTGIGVNSVLSKALGEGKGDKAARSCINGYLLMIFFYVIFLAFGLACFSSITSYLFRLTIRREKLVFFVRWVRNVQMCLRFSIPKPALLLSLTSYCLLFAPLPSLS